MMNKRHTRTQMVTLLRQAMDQDHVDSDPSLDDEHLILLATGRLGELSDDEQIRVLNRVSADDQTAQLLKQLRDLDLEPAPVAITLSIMNSPLRRGVTGAWVAAACVLVCFGYGVLRIHRWEATQTQAHWIPRD
ncbi:MAG: hypothetical protein JKX85_03260 [Phycisphaeraceae bacterium]|nr:hypothetical protein [Phycisphaeraceae bacterium]